MIRLWRLTKDMLWGVAAVLAAACSADAEVPAAADGRSPVTFSLGRSLTVGTRAANHTVGNSWEVGDALGVKCTVSGEAGQPGTVKRYVVANNGGGLQLQGADAANTFWWLDKSDAKSFQLWYPYSAAMPTSMSVPADQGSVADLDAYDLLYAAVGSRTAANMPETSLAFYHQAARLTVNIAGVDTGDDGETVTQVRLGSDNVAVSATDWVPATSNYDSGSGSGGAGWTCGTQSATVTLHALSAGNSYACILPPQDIGSESATLLTVTTNSSKSYTCTGSLALRAGNAAVLNVTVKQSGLSVVGAITAFGNEGGSASGNATGGGVDMYASGSIVGWTTSTASTASAGGSAYNDDITEPLAGSGSVTGYGSSGGTSEGTSYPYDHPFPMTYPMTGGGSVSDFGNGGVGTEYGGAYSDAADYRN